MYTYIYIYICIYVRRPLAQGTVGSASVAPRRKSRSLHTSQGFQGCGLIIRYSNDIPCSSNVFLCCV